MTLSHCCCADLLKYLRATEKEKDIKPDPAVDAYLKASAIEGKLFSPSTQYVMRLLGLEVCAVFKPAMPSTPVQCLFVSLDMTFWHATAACSVQHC